MANILVLGGMGQFCSSDWYGPVRHVYLVKLQYHPGALSIWYSIVRMDWYGRPCLYMLYLNVKESFNFVKLWGQSAKDWSKRDMLYLYSRLECTSISNFQPFCDEWFCFYFCIRIEEMICDPLGNVSAVKHTKTFSYPQGI